MDTIRIREDAQKTHRYECPRCGLVSYYTDSVDEVLPCPDCCIGETDEVKRVDDEGNNIYVKHTGHYPNDYTYRKVYKGWNSPGVDPKNVPGRVRFYY